MHAPKVTRVNWLVIIFGPTIAIIYNTATTLLPIARDAYTVTASVTCGIKVARVQYSASDQGTNLLLR